MSSVFGEAPFFRKEYNNQGKLAIQENIRTLAEHDSDELAKFS